MSVTEISRLRDYTKACISACVLLYCSSPVATNRGGRRLEVTRRNETGFAGIDARSVQAALIDAIDRAAHRDLVSRSGYIRQAVIARLRADGVGIEEAQAL